MMNGFVPVWCVGKDVMTRLFFKKSPLKPRARQLPEGPSTEASGQPPQPVYATEMQVEGLPEVPVEQEPQLPAQRSFKLPKPQINPSWRIPMLWLASFSILGGMGTAALVWLVSLPPQVDCRNPKRLTLDMEKLYCAQVAAQSGELPNLVAGIHKLEAWDKDHPLHREAQRLIGDWSDQVYTQAIRKVEQGDLPGAEAAIREIPASAPVYPDAQKALVRWKKYSQTATKIYNDAQKALKDRKWGVVSQQIVLLAEFERDYWDLEKGSDEVAQQLGVEKQAWQTLTRAQKMATTATVPQLQTAIPLARQVPAKTYAAETAKTNLKQWSQKLVAIGSQQWQKGNRAGAVQTLSLATTLPNQPEIRDLYQFGNAYRLAQSALDERWVPSWGELLKLQEAIAAMQQVSADSPFYKQAQALKQSWQAQWQDLVQIKYASTVASLGQPSMLNLAIGQAKQIEAKRPRRQQAQSLIAFWDKEVERLEDQPTMNRAVQLASSGTLDALKEAIGQASQIKLGRALRTQAQTLIATWRSQIQTLEDRPKLDSAWSLARQGKLSEAIQTAGEIQAGRSLYGSAQSAIREWRNQQIINAQIAQDQPILDRANALANAGNLAAAISTAAQIDAGRALSGEARSAINRWEEQLNPPPPEPAPLQLSPDRFEPSWQQDYSDSLPSNAPLMPASPSALDGAETFPSPTMVPAAPRPDIPRELELVPPQTTYEPFPQPTIYPEPSTPPVVPEATAPAPVEEPAPPADPLPPGPVDPLPPSP